MPVRLINYVRCVSRRGRRSEVPERSRENGFLDSRPGRSSDGSRRSKRPAGLAEPSRRGSLLEPPDCSRLRATSSAVRAPSARNRSAAARHSRSLAMRRAASTPFLRVAPGWVKASRMARRRSAISTSSPLVFGESGNRNPSGYSTSRVWTNHPVSAVNPASGPSTAGPIAGSPQAMASRTARPVKAARSAETST